VFRQRKTKILDDEALYAYAIRLLSGRALSAGEVRQKLIPRATEGASVDMVIARLREYGFLDDKRFAEGFATARRDNQGLGAFRVARDLKKRRVAPALADEAVSQAYQGVDETTLIEQYLERRMRGKDFSDERVAASAYRRLCTAGFSSGPIIRVLKRHTARAEELESLEDSSGGDNEEP
jgi:regulatory protein